MKRPFACVGFSMLFSLVFAIAFHTAVIQTAVVCFVLSAFLFAVKALGKRNTLAAAVCFLSAGIAMVEYWGIVKYYVNPIISEYDGKTVDFSGMVISSPYTNGDSTHFTVKTNTVNGKKKRLNINITTSNTLPMEIYDFVEGKGTLSSEYKSGYNYESYYGAKNIFLSAYINPYFGSNYSVTHNDNKPFYSVFNNIRSCIANIFQKFLSCDEAALCIAIITGEKNYLSDEVYSSFSILGISHILVVSGLHLSIVADLLYLIASNTIKNRYASALLQIVGVTAFAALTGFGFSVRRALVMTFFLILGRFFGSRADDLNSLGFAAFLMCLNPLNAGDIGLLWSFSCTLSIILLSNRMTDFIVDRLAFKSGLLMKFISLLSTSASALVGSVPFFILVTGSVSPYTIFVNILTVPFTGIIIVCGGISAVLFLLRIYIASYPLMLVSGLTAKYLNFITGIFYKLPYSSIKTDETFVYIWFAITGVGIAILVIYDKKKIYIRLGVVTSAAVIIGLFSINTVLNSDKIVFSILDVGNGMTLTVKKGDNIVVFNSYGEKYQYHTIKNELSRFEKITCLIDMPPNKTDYNYCRWITNDFNVQKILVYRDIFYDENYSYMQYLGVDVEKVSDAYKLHLFEDAELNIVNTENCMWQYLTVYGTEILICPMNADFDELPERFGNPQIAILSSSADNFSLKSRAYVVVSSYGEECAEISDFLSGMGMTVEATDGNGQINFIFSKNGEVDVKREYTGGVTRYADN